MGLVRRFAAISLPRTRYTAECQDLPTLVDFVKRYYGRGPESPATGQAACGDGFYP